MRTVPFDPGGTRPASASAMTSGRAASTTRTRRVAIVLASYNTCLCVCVFFACVCVRVCVCSIHSAQYEFKSRISVFISSMVSLPYGRKMIDHSHSQI
jgi:hypothetical protein